MRLVACIVAAAAFAPQALADDLDILRGAAPAAPAVPVAPPAVWVGPATFTRWSGFYFGGQAGYGGGTADFANATQAPLEFALRETTLENEFAPSNWPVLGQVSQTGAIFGGFVGYNTQWQDLVLGVEGNYNHVSFSMVAPNTKVGPLITPTDSQGYTHIVTINGTGSMTMSDYVSVRGRAGAIYGDFLPYGFVGLAIGRATTNISAVASDYFCNTTTDVCGLATFNANAGAAGQVTYGFVVGGGLDVALGPNLFVRGELEYAQFAPISGIVAEIISARAGAGFKF